MPGAETGEGAGEPSRLTVAVPPDSRSAALAATDREGPVWALRVAGQPVDSSDSEVVHHRVVHSRPDARNGLIVRARMYAIRQKRDVHGPLGINPQRRPRKTHMTERSR